MLENQPNYNRIKLAAQRFYSSIGRAYSPALNHDVIFSSEGFNHIIFKNSRSERERSSQIMRFKLLPLARKLIELSTTYQEYEETLQGFIIKKHGRKIKVITSVRYWGIIAIIDGRKIKVIVRRMGDGGKLYFWSIIPAWVTNRYRDAKFISTMNGQPAED
jgi:hypothetical protein